MNIKVKDMIDVLIKLGYVHARTKGDHRIFVKKGKRPFVVNGKLSSDATPPIKKTFLKLLKEENYNN